ncbi:MAG: hypothetical protein A2086_07980 [Spirochaetes bacterium GWD1_27_9]|nr:MAG: hypothetical protein A2Y34_18700 [Spirochaetes bacterium GWC1_27_15]OHD34460.1 MAG: hypothetical protein A2086_07980 [Spirochaetes bacterium GWD1_27_9]
MKSNIIAILFILFSVSFIFAEDVIIPQNNTNLYVKYEAIWSFEKEGDLEKTPKDVKEKKLLNFGNKVLVIGNKKIKDAYYIQFQLPDKTKYWASLDNFAIKFITIIEKDLVAYTQPDDSYLAKFKLQPGCFGYYIKENDGFINVDIASYIPKKQGQKSIWAGNVWIKKGYTDDIKVASQGILVARAFNLLYGKTYNAKDGLTKLNEALELLGEDTVLSPFIANLVTELDGGGITTTTTTNPPIEKKVGSFYAPSVENLRFRETASVDGKFIRMLQKGESLELLEKGSQETINGVTGFWSKFKTSSGEIGWCFDAYIDEIK